MSVDPGAISTAEATREVRIRHPNVTIDQSQVRHERNLRLKASRSAAKGVVTRRQNEAREIMSDFGDVKDLELKRAELDEAIKNFDTAHQAYHGQLEDRTEIDDSQEYYDATLLLANDTRRIIDDWIQVGFKQPPGANSEPNLQPEDSVSNSNVGSRTVSKSKTRSKACSRSSRSSSVSGARVAAAAKRASLAAEASMLREQQALQQEELRLQQRKQQLVLETEIVKLKAEECVLAEAEARFTAAGKIKGVRNIVSPVVKTDFCEPEASKVMPSDTQRLFARTEQLPISDLGAGRHRHREVDSRNSISSEEGFRQFMDLQWQQQEQNRNIMHIQQQQNHQVQQLLKQQQLHTLALTLPQPEVPTFTGDPIEYCNFIRAFENMIEAKTTSYSARLYYLVQYTTGDVQELMRSCLAMDSEKGYREARKLLTKCYGQPYRIASACVERVTNGPAIKPEDGAALQSFSVLLTSCKNTLTDIGYLSKIENPDSLKKVVSRLPFNLRQKWRDVADTITERQEREVTISDVASFVEEKARILTHPIFGDISSEPKGKGGLDKRKSTSRRVSSFAADAHNPDHTGEGVSEEISVPRFNRNSLCCPLCKSPHWLSQCNDFRRRGVSERYEFVREKELCYNCLVPGHYVAACPKTSFCKVDGCHDKHSTFLHLPSARFDDATQPETGAQSAYVSVGKPRRSVTGAGT